MGNKIWSKSSFDMNNSDGKASLKRQKSRETTTDTQGMSKFLLILRVKYSYFEIFIVVNRPYFVPHTIPYNVFKFSTVGNETKESVMFRNFTFYFIKTT